MKVIIIEDEDVAYRSLLKALQKLDDSIQVISWLKDVKSTKEWLQTNPHPDLILADIHLGDGSVFDVFETVMVQSPIIFTTAYDNYAIKAFELNSIDYLLKPIKEEKLLNSIRKFKKNANLFISDDFSGQMKSLLYSMSLKEEVYKERFLIKTGDKYFNIGVDEVAYFYAESNIVYLISNKADRYIVNYSIEQLNGVLNPKFFFRASRKYIICITSIKNVNKYFNSRLKVNLNPPTEDQLLVSRVKSPDFLEWLEGI